MKRLVFVLGLFGVIMLATAVWPAKSHAYIFGAPGTPYPFDVYNGQYQCQKHVSIVKQGILPDGSPYQVVNFILAGDDNATGAKNEAGSLLPVFNNCPTPDPNDALIWDSTFTVHPANLTYNGAEPIDVYMGGQAGGPPDATFCGAAPTDRVNHLDPAGNTCITSGAWVGEVNDGGATAINGKEVYCIGMGRNMANLGVLELPPNVASSCVFKEIFDPSSEPQGYFGAGWLQYKEKYGPPFGWPQAGTNSGLFDPAANPFLPTLPPSNVPDYNNPNVSLFSNGNPYSFNKSGITLGNFLLQLWGSNTWSPWYPFVVGPSGTVSNAPNFAPPPDRTWSAFECQYSPWPLATPCIKEKNAFAMTFVYPKPGVTATCNSVLGFIDTVSGDVIPTNPEVNQNFGVKFGAPTGLPAGTPYSITVNSVTPGSGGGVVGLIGSQSGVAPAQSDTFPNVSSASAQAYTVHFKAAWAGAPGGGINCTAPLTVVQKPYVKVFGNDAAAGGKFADITATSCSNGPTPASPPAAFWTFSKKASANGINYYGGGGTQFASFAQGQNLEFSSAAARNGVGAPNPAVGLSFGNMISTGIVTDFGGKGGASVARCIPDYYSAGFNPDGSTKPTTSGAFYLPSDGCIGSTNCFLGLGGKVPMTPFWASHSGLFVNGDLRVVGDIYYDGSGYCPTPPSVGTCATNGWPDVNSIQSSYTIVRGDIYIDKNVHHLDGTYIAQKKPDGTGGHIYTCTDAPDNPPGNKNAQIAPSLIPADNLYSQCQAKLVITGSFIANEVKFQRVRGTVNGSIASSGPTPTGLGLNYNEQNIINGTCVALYDPNSSQPKGITWYDNFLCSPTNLNIQFAPDGPIPGQTCINIPRDTEPKAYGYMNHYLCWPPSENLGLKWSQTGPIPGMSCIQIYEDADPLINGVGFGKWFLGQGPPSPVYLCEPQVAGSPYTPTNEDAGSDNIAEIFNFSQEMYLAPTPDVLQSVIGGGSSGANKYDAVTSLPPVL